MKKWTVSLDAKAPPLAGAGVCAIKVTRTWFPDEGRKSAPIAQDTHTGFGDQPAQAVAVLLNRTLEAADGDRFTIQVARLLGDSLTVNAVRDIRNLSSLTPKARAVIEALLNGTLSDAADALIALESST